MKTNWKSLLALSGSLVVLTAGAQTVIEDFEYASDADLWAEWMPGTGSIMLSSYVAAGSSGTNSMEVYRYFNANDWETQVLTGPPLTTPVVIGANQYLSFRIAGDPEFSKGTFNQLYIYAYDSAGNFGRWGSAVPATTNWQVVNLAAKNIEKPWDSPALPTQTDIVQFKIFIYGQGAPAGEAFEATIYLDDLTVRDAPLIDFPPPAPVRALIDDFEGYADDAALHAFYTAKNSPAATATAFSLARPAPQGSQALQLHIDFAAGRYPWGAALSAAVAPFSLPDNAVVQFWVKGDPSLASVVDDGTVFYISFYDESGAAVHYTSTPPVVAADWQLVKAPASAFWSGAVTDTGNLVQWRILVEGWNGTDESPARSGDFYVDDLRITVPPGLALVQDGANLSLNMSSLLTGTTYTLRQTTDFISWTTSTFTATGPTRSLPITAGTKGFYQLYYTP